MTYNNINTSPNKTLQKKNGTEQAHNTLAQKDNTTSRPVRHNTSYRGRNPISINLLGKREASLERNHSGGRANVPPSISHQTKLSFPEIA